MAKMYTLDKKLLVGTPEIRIGDKCFPVDDREKTVKKILKVAKEAENSQSFDRIDEIFGLAFSQKDYKEIDGMNLPFAAYQELFTIVISAVTGQDLDSDEGAGENPDERFQKAE
jgi:hypothetical protein